MLSFLLYSICCSQNAISLKLIESADSKPVLLLSSQRCGSNWQSRVIRKLGANFGNEGLLDYCWGRRAKIYGNLDACIDQQKNGHVCEKDELAKCTNGILKNRFHDGFLIKYDHFGNPPQFDDISEYFKLFSIRVIHVTRNPLSMFLSLLDHHFQNAHNSNYPSHHVNVNDLVTFVRELNQTSHAWSNMLSSKGIETLSVTYEGLTHADRRDWSKVAMFMGLSIPDTNPNTWEGKPVAVPGFNERIKNWPEVESALEEEIGKDQMATMQLTQMRDPLFEDNERVVTSSYMNNMKSVVHQKELFEHE